MRYHALACDYDGTLATDGRAPRAVLSALESLKRSGRSLILVTGRELEDILAVFPGAALFDRVVAENGALLYRPADRTTRLLASPPPAAFGERLDELGIRPLSAGKVIVATTAAHRAALLATIHELGLELHVIFNRTSAMVLPSGVNKATGLAAALAELGLSPRNVVGVGDAENDHAFLELCEAGVAVANAVPALKERADWVTDGAEGEGSIQLARSLEKDDLSGLARSLERHEVALGRRDGEARPAAVPPYGSSLLVAGSSGSGKSTLATGFLERLAEKGYQFCIVDPEGDYEGFPAAVSLGGSERAPLVAEVLGVLADPSKSAAVNLLAVGMEGRPVFFGALLAALQDMRARLGRPHWLVIDEAHHLLPTAWTPAREAARGPLGPALLITVHPEQVSPAALSEVDIALAVGASPERTLRAFCGAAGLHAPPAAPALPAQGEALAWWKGSGEAPFVLDPLPPRAERRRHRRKYAEGELGPDRSFYFRGPSGALNLRAQNLRLFLQVGDGVDDATWLHHLRRGDYSRWFREAIKDDELAEAAKAIEADAGLAPDKARELLRARIVERYADAA